MPFLFHAYKKSIFDVQVKQQQLDQFQALKVQQIQQKKRRHPAAYSINVQICREHPFRKINTNVKSELEESAIQNGDLFTLEKQKIIYKYKLMKAQKSKYMSQNVLNQLDFKQTKNQKDDKFNICIQNANNKNSLQNQKPVLKPKHNKNFNLRHSKSFNNNASSKKVSKTKQQRLLFQMNQTPGPGKYENKIKQSSGVKSLVFYRKKQKKINTTKNQNYSKLEYNHKQQLNKLKNCQKRQSLNDIKLSKTGQAKQPKNKDLLNMILSKFKMQKDQVLYDCQEQFQTIQNRQPSPDVYQAKSQFSKNFQNRKNIFISGADRLPTIKCNYVAAQDPNIQQVPSKKKSSNIPFMYSCARQLHFDNQQLCKQQFYYSPKNNFIDSAHQKSKYQAKNFFGSSLQRFIIPAQQQQDCYKYCMSKLQQKQINSGVSMKFTQKRQIFKDLINNDIVGPKYNQTSGTISAKVEKQAQKILLKSKFKDEVITMKNKKKQLEYNLMDLKKSQKMITSSKPLIQNQSDKKQNVKKQNNNISFGQNVFCQNERGFKPRQQFDGYYQKEDNWDLQSFNKHYKCY